MECKNENVRNSPPAAVTEIQGTSPFLVEMKGNLAWKAGKSATKCRNLPPLILCRNLEMGKVCTQIPQTAEQNFIQLFDKDPEMGDCSVYMDQWWVFTCF